MLWEGGCLSVVGGLVFECCRRMGVGVGVGVSVGEGMCVGIVGGGMLQASQQRQSLLGAA